MSLKTYLHRFDEARRDGKPKETKAPAKPKVAVAPPGPNGPLPSGPGAENAVTSSIPPGAKTISPATHDQPESASSPNAETAQPQNRLHTSAGERTESSHAPGDLHTESEGADSEYDPISESEFESFDTQFRGKTKKIARSTRPKGYEELKSALRVELLNVLNLAELDSMALSDREMLVRQVVEDLPGLRDAPLNKRERSQIIRELMDEVFGFGPLEPLLSDHTITEILVNAHDKVYVERGGILELSNVTFKDNEHVMLIASRIVGPLGRRIDDSSPMCDARLPDGSRVNIIIPPLATQGPCITIRRFTSMPTSINKLIEYGSIPSRLALVLLACVKAKLNTIISGGTGTGKCVVGNTPVVLSDGRIVQIKDLVEETFSRQQITTDRDNWLTSPGDREVLTFDPQKGNLKQAKIARVWRHQAPSTLISISTRSGKQITVTPEHPFFTIGAEGEGMTQIRADQLQRGMRIATPNHLPIRTKAGKLVDLYDWLEELDGLYVPDQQPLVRDALHRLKGKKNLHSRQALAQDLGYRFLTLRSWTMQNAIPLPQLARLMKIAEIPFSKINPAVKVKAKNSGATMRMPRTPSPEMMRFIGMILGDGHLRERYVELTNTDHQLLREFLSLANRVFGVSGEIKEFPPRTSRARICSTALAEVLNKVFSIPIGNKAARARIADWIFTLPDEHIGALLGGLFDCDAGIILRASKDGDSINGKHYTAIEYSTKSAALANDVSYLLQRLGLIGRLHKRNGQYYITLYGANAISKFAQSVQMLSSRKKAIISQIESLSIKGNTNIDTYPNVGGMIQKVRSKAEMRQGDLAKATGLSRRAIRFYETGERNPSRGSLQQIAAAFSSVDSSPEMDSLKRLAEMPIFWDEVKEVTPLTNHDEKYVYDLTVDRTHTFVAGWGGGIVTHNTTLLNVLSSAIPENERIVTIEDVAELQLQQEHVVKLEARQPNIEGKGEITLRQLVKNSLRMRPDRIVVGEVRGGEAFDMLQAMSTGHDGSLATVHANTPRDALSRVGMLILMADLNLPELAIRQYISRAIDVVVQIRRLRDGSRKIVGIAEITGMEGEVISMQELFAFKELGMDKNGKVIGNWRGSGVRPNFMDKLDAAGIKLPPDVFSERVIQA